MVSLLGANALAHHYDPVAPQLPDRAMSLIGAEASVVVKPEAATLLGMQSGDPR
jgi:hypothetical protein